MEKLGLLSLKGFELRFRGRPASILLPIKQYKLLLVFGLTRQVQKIIMRQ
jgi:hypothetical protein